MCSERRPAACMRSALRDVLPPKAFLKRDRGSALFITNAPLFNPAIEAIPGFILIPGDRLLRILPDGSWVARAEQAAPPDQLSASLIRFRDTEPDMDGLKLFAQGMKLLDMLPDLSPRETEAFGCELRRRAALALRGAASGGALYASALILHHLNHQIHEGE